MNKRHFECFATAMNTLSVKRTAEQLHMTPQAVSKTIIEFEKELGEKLFERAHGRLIPEKNAYYVLRHVEKILSEYELLGKIGKTSAHKKQLFFITTFEILLLLRSDFIIEFQKKYPDIVITLIETSDKDAMRRIESGEIETGILTGPVQSAVLEKRYLFRRKFCCVVSKSSKYAHLKYVDDTVAREANIALCGGKEFNVYEPDISRYINRGITPNIFIESTSSSAIKEIIRKNLAVGVMLDYIAEDIISDDEVIIPLEDEQQCADFYFVYSKETPLFEVASLLKEFLLPLLVSWITKSTHIPLKTN